MTVYYVDFVNGLDANNGLGPDASHATNKPWKTIAKLLGAAGFASGDTAYLSPAGPFREVVTIAMTSPTVTTNIIGDPQNTRGFKTSGGVLVAPGPVQWTAYTTNDTTAPSGLPVLQTAARDFLKFSNIWFTGGTGASSPFRSAMDIPVGSTDLTFQDCCFFGGAAFNVTLIAMTLSADVNSNILFDRCIFFNRNTCLGPNLTRSTSADYDCGLTIRNSLLLSLGGNGVNIGQAGASAFFGGGVDVLNCTILTGASGVVTNAAQVSTSIPCTVNNTFIAVQTTCLSANTSGQITESYNLLHGNAARTNVTAGTGSIATANTVAVFSLGQEILQGLMVRPFGMPIAGSPMLNFAAGASPPAVDLWNRDRPSGGAGTNMGVGALERHDFGVRETTTVDTGGLAVKLTGPGDHEFKVPVTSGVSTTIALKVNYDATHGTTNPPQAQLIANAAVGFAGETKTAAASTGTFLTLTFSAFTPTASGYVILRLRSRSASGAGVAIFDTVSVT